jgi:thymidylate synthase
MTENYKELVKKILDEGAEINGRNGKTLTIPFYSFSLDHSNGENHILKLRKMWYKGVKGEFKTLISREELTNVSQFEKNGCNYWKKWAGNDGSLNLDYYNELHPALENVISQIRRDPESRRHVISLWNNKNAFNGSLSLPCCWHNLTFTIIHDTLHLTWTQRSTDVMIGLPADIYLSYLFMEHIANNCALKIGTCMYALSNVHIYDSHLNNAKILLTRTEEDNEERLDFELKE